MSKLQEIGFELSKMWQHMTREELCEQLNISNRTLYRYQSMLGLETKAQNPIKAEKEMFVFINTKDNKVKKQTFKSWNHFAIWSKAQSHPFRITDKEVINIDYSKQTDEAKKFYKELNVRSD